LLLYTLIYTFDNFSLFSYPGLPVLPVTAGHLLYLHLPLRHPLMEVASVLDLSELHSKQCGVLLSQSVMGDIPGPVSDRAEGFLPEGLLDGQVEGTHTALAGLHVLVPLGEDVAQLQTVVVVGHSVHYGLEGP
jgi:hypothetical protein